MGTCLYPALLVNCVPFFYLGMPHFQFVYSDESLLVVMRNICLICLLRILEYYENYAVVCSRVCL